MQQCRISLFLMFLVFLTGCVTTTSQDSGLTACTLEAKLCPDGTFVGREGETCEFAACPELESCSIDAPCSEGRQCYVLPSSDGPVCYLGNPCQLCGNPVTCVVLESFPAQVTCD